MNRKDFLRGLGIASAGALVSPGHMLEAKPQADCVLIPTETAGPFPLDLTANTEFFRQDVREDRTGVQLNVKLKIVGADNCGPMPNVRVNIWHCDKDGLYSGYSQTNNPGQAGKTYLRGYQFTDANGEASFITIFPGWYSGRICHIHFQVYVSASYAAISQLTFDISAKNAIYTQNPTLYTKGTDPMTLAQDNIFSDGYTYQIATLTPNAATGGYDAFLEVTVQGSGTTGLSNLERETAKQFTLGQNYPNPFSFETTIPVELHYAGEVEIQLWDLSGRQVASLPQGALGPGEHLIPVDLNQLGLPSASYVYQVEVTNTNGVFRSVKVMTASR